MNELLISITQWPDPVVDAWLLDEQGSLISTHPQCSLDSLADMAPASCTVLLGGGLCLLTQASVPPGSQQQRQQALPYALEDSLLDEVEQQHFVVLNRWQDETLAVAVVKKTLMAEIMAACDRAGLALSRVVPACLALPYDGSATTLAYTEQQVIARTGEVAGFSLLQQAELLAALEVQRRTWPERPIALYHENPVPWPSEVLASMQRHAVVLGTCFAQTLKEHTINLCQGEFAIRSQKTVATKQWWRLAGVLGSTFLIINTVSFIAIGLTYHHKARAAEQVTQQIYHRLFPQASAVIDPTFRVSQLMHQRAGTATDAGFFTLLDRAGPLIAKHPRVHLSALAYANKRLTVSVTGKAPAVQSLQQALRRSGLSVKQQHTTGTQSVTWEIRA